ncbi:MAG TPA: hypothetical protein VI408_00310 [Gaiellaceae bacterium]
MRLSLSLLVVVALVAAAPGAARAPRLLAWPTSVEVQRDGSLLVVENGTQRVLQIAPATGRVRVVARGFSKAIAAVRTPAGDLLVSDDLALRRIARNGARTVVATAAAPIGPVAVAADGAVFFTAGAKLEEVADGTTRTLAASLVEPHGVAVAGRVVLVSDTGHGNVLAVDRDTGATRIFARVAEPRGIAVGPNGWVYVVAAAAKRVLRFTGSGARRGSVGPRFGDPYAVAVAPDGTVFVVDTAAVGTVVRIDRRGRAAPV